MRTALSSSQSQSPQQKRKKTKKSIYDDYDDDDDSADEAIEREQRRQYGLNDMHYLERQLVESIRLDETMKLTVNRRISSAIEKRVLHVPVLAFFLVGYSRRCQFVDDFDKQLVAKYEVELLGQPIPLNREHLSLDLFHYDEDYRRIISIIIYLESLQPPMRCVISRQPIAITPHALELFPPESSPQPPLLDGDDQSPPLTTAITTTTITTNDSNNTTTTTTRVTHSSSSGSESPRMTIPVVQTSAFERLVYNVMRMRQTGHYYMLYVDLPLSINTLTTTGTKTNTNG